MPESTVELWDRQNAAVGDRRGLYAAVGETFDVTRALYPGSYVDIAPSFVFDDVVYVDTDRRANRFFGDTDGVARIIDTVTPGRRPTFRFLHADYTTPLDVSEPVDLLISLYAGFVSEHCTDHLRVGGILLVNPSHGDAAMASIDDRYRLAGVVQHRSDRYTISTDDLHRYLIPKRPVEITAESLRATGRGIAYTVPAFAYVFERVR